jgi:hypothetical protein
LWAKTLYEKVSAKEMDATALPLIKSGGLISAEIKDTPDFVVLFTQAFTKTFWKKTGYAAQVRGLETSRGAHAGSHGGGSGEALSSEGSGFAPVAYQRHLEHAAARPRPRPEAARSRQGAGGRGLTPDAVAQLGDIRQLCRPGQPVGPHREQSGYAYQDTAVLTDKLSQMEMNRGLPIAGPCVSTRLAQQVEKDLPQPHRVHGERPEIGWRVDRQPILVLFGELGRGLDRRSVTSRSA